MTEQAEDCGCDNEKDEFAEFAKLATAADDDTPDLDHDPRGSTVRVWRGLLAPYNTETGDGRQFSDGALESRPLPLPIKWQRQDNPGHGTSSVVGRIDRISFEPDGAYGEGIFFDPDPEQLPRLAEDCNEAYTLTKEGVIGPSVDLDAMQYEPIGEPAEYADGSRQKIKVTSGRISSATLVPIPAFAEARPFSLSDVDADEYNPETMVASAFVLEQMHELPVSDDKEWSLTSWLEGDDRSGALFQDDAGRLLFPVAVRGDNGMTLVPAAVADSIAVMATHGDSLDVGAGDRQAIRDRLEELAVRCELPTPPWKEQEMALTAAGVSAATVLPADLFADPKLDRPTPIRVEKRDDGQLHVYGHLASWKTCHIGFQDRCVTAPKSKSNYAYFHLGEVETSEGPLAVGKITLGGGHADTRLGFRAAAEHYDRTSATVAKVRAGQDDHGIWVSGVIPDTVSQARIDELAASPLSGDWRKVAGNLEMVAALAVNTPGFPVVRVGEDDKGAFSLVAAGAVMDERVKANLAKRKKKAAKINDADADDTMGGWSLQDVADAVFHRIVKGERDEQETREAFATLERSFADLETLDAQQSAIAFL